MTWAQAIWNEYIVGCLIVIAVTWPSIIRSCYRMVADDIRARIAHNQQLAYIAGWNAAHEQIRAQLSQLPGEQPRTVH